MQNFVVEITNHMKDCINIEKKIKGEHINLIYKRKILNDRKYLYDKKSKK
jgi:hypothetical protein